MALDKIKTAMIEDDAVTLAKAANTIASVADVNVVESDADKIQTNLAILAFKTAATGSLAKYSLKDQIIDEFVDATGVNAGDSTYEELTSGVYRGENPTGGNVTPTISHDADATGTDGDYTWYKWTGVGAGTYGTNTAQVHEFLVVAGGGGGGGCRGGGGGAGGLRSSYGSVSGGGASQQTDLTLGTAPTYTITVGGGGAGGAAPSSGTAGANGGVSSITGSDITDVVTVGGGAGLGNASPGSHGNTGGSGGGITDNQSGSYDGGVGTSGEGYAGHQSSGGSSGGGGGAAGTGTEGSTLAGGNGGAGLNITITGASVGYAGGGGGGLAGGDDEGTVSHGGGVAVIGSGAAGTGTAGTVNTGGGGAGGHDTAGGLGGAGGTGVVILRRLTTIVQAAPGDLILQSSDTTAEAAPTNADMVILVEDAGSGVGTINTHIKGWISRYETGGTKTWTQGTLVDEGDWGTDKRILAFHDLTLTGTSGTQMAYKITTHSSSAVYDTRIHATSIGWR